MDLYAQLMNAPGPKPAPGEGDLTASPSGLSESDVGNGARLARAFAGRLIYVGGKGWAVREGSRYSFRGGDVAALALGRQLADIVRGEARAAAEAEPSEVEIKRYLAAELAKGKPRFGDPESARKHLRRDRRARWEAWAKKCEALTKIRAAMELARSDLWVDIEDLDRDPHSLTVPGGRVDLRRVVDTPDGLEGPALVEARAAWWREQDWSAMPTKCTGVPFDPAADCPRWREFLALVQPDPDYRAFVQRVFGRLVYGRNPENLCVLIRGEGGNGKSTFTDTLSFVLGARDGYAASCKVDMFLVTRESSTNAANPEEVHLPGARAYFASEPAATDTFSAKKIKALTSGNERRQVRGLNKDPFEYYPTGTPVISFNRTPRIKDEDEGTRRRLLFVAFDVRLSDLPPERKRDGAEVLEELKAEGPGILNWLLEGYRLYRRDGLAVPEASRQLKEDLMAEGDPIGQFLSDLTQPEPEARISLADMLAAFRAWCAETGAAEWSGIAFGKALLEKGLRKRKRSAWFWIGRAWKADPYAADVLTKAGVMPPSDAPPIPPEDAAGFDPEPF